MAYWHDVHLHDRFDRRTLQSVLWVGFTVILVMKTQIVASTECISVDKPGKITQHAWSQSNNLACRWLACPLATLKSRCSLSILVLVFAPILKELPLWKVLQPCDWHNLNRNWNSIIVGGSMSVEDLPFYHDGAVRSLGCPSSANSRARYSSYHRWKAVHCRTTTHG